MTPGIIASPPRIGTMKPNPFTLPLIVAGVILTLIGVLMTVVTATGEMSLGQLAVVPSLLVAVGTPILAAGLVVAGIDWRLTRRG